MLPPTPACNGSLSHAGVLDLVFSSGTREEFSLVSLVPKLRLGTPTAKLRFTQKPEKGFA
jgi:hypothetical protein